MPSAKLISALVALSLGVGSNLAFAQAERDQREQAQNQLDTRGGQRPQARPQQREQNRVEQRPAYRGNSDNRDARGRGAGPDHAFYRGGRLPSEYRNRQYVVDDWRGHHLSAPPRGYHWVQTGGDYVLVAIATGVILSILLNQ